MTETATAPRFDSVQAVRDALRDVDYLADDGIAGVAYLADRLGKPVLIEGPAGTGKTQLAKSIAEMTGSRLIRLAVLRGTRRVQGPLRVELQEAAAAHPGRPQQRLVERGPRRHLLRRVPPHPAAPRGDHADDPVVLLIDEVDRVEVETEALLLEILSDYQVSIPELGTIEAKQIPLVFLTSNNTRELSEALKRRCLYLHVDYPTLEREKEIVLAKVPGVTENLADQISRILRSIRQLDLKKSPSVSETLDWARTLMLLNVDVIDEQTAKDTLHILLKYQTDIAKAAKELSVDE
jgi:MoxR-like ATPase